MLGTPASVRLRLMMSFKQACLAYLPGPSPQDNPCEPSAVTNPPHGHMWGSQVLAPKRRHCAILITSSSSLKPQADSGSASSQSPAWAAVASLRRARWYSSLQSAISTVASFRVGGHPTVTASPQSPSGIGLWLSSDHLSNRVSITPSVSVKLSPNIDA